jgi:hypothetical protein
VTDPIEDLKVTALALAWFRECDWPRWCSIDPLFQPDYQHWLGRSEAAFERYRAAGVPILKVVIRPDEFMAWSLANGAGIHTHARAHYAVLKMQSLEEREKRCQPAR